MLFDYKKILFLTSFTIFFLQIYAQPPAVEEEIQQDEILESVTENEDTPLDEDVYLEQLYHYQQHPLNLNIATETELASLNILSDQQILAFLNYRNRNGALLTIYELQAVPYFDRSIIMALLPFVTVAPPAQDYKVNLGRMLARGRHQLFLRYSEILEDQKGFIQPDTVPPAQKYAGSSYRLYTRYKYSYRNNLSLGVTAEKDPGEEFFTGSQPQGFDYYSAHIFLRDQGKIKAIAVGDYEVKLGQGLVMWNGFGFGKSPEVLNIRKSSYKLRPYTSVNEYFYLRGAAAQLQFGNFQLLAFGSRKKLDANISILDTTFNEVQQVSSLQQTGLHRTLAELADKHALTENIVGGHIAYNGDRLDLGITATNSQLSAPLQLLDLPYNYFAFSGTQLTNASINYDLILRNILLFGETAISSSGGIASVNGLNYNLDGKTSIALLFRHYDKEYFSFYSNAFGEGTKTNNETGIFAGLTTAFSPKIYFKTYLDIYRFPWLRYLVDAPSTGYDFLSQLTYRPNWRTELYFRYKTETKEKNTPENISAVDYLSPQSRTTYRFNFTFKPQNNLVLKNRVEYVTFSAAPDAEAEDGFLIFQDVIYQFRQFPLKIAGRYALFSTDSWNTRIYAYENDVLYAFSIPPYYDSGTRFYILLNYKFSRHLEAWLRFAQFYYPDKNIIGAGLDQIEGNTRSEIKAQVRLRW